jgi:hypothetical protein
MELDDKIRDAYFAAKGRNGSLRPAKDLQVHPVFGAHHLKLEAKKK